MAGRGQDDRGRSYLGGVPSTRVAQQPGGNSTFSLGWGQEEPRGHRSGNDRGGPPANAEPPPRSGRAAEYAANHNSDVPWTRVAQAPGGESSVCLGCDTRPATDGYGKSYGDHDRVGPANPRALMSSGYTERRPATADDRGYPGRQAGRQDDWGGQEAPAAGGGRKPGRDPRQAGSWALDYSGYGNGGGGSRNRDQDGWVDGPCDAQHAAGGATRGGGGRGTQQLGSSAMDVGGYGNAAAERRVPQPHSSITASSAYGNVDDQRGRPTSNDFACGNKQNMGNKITSTPTTRVLMPPGGRSQISFG